MKPITPTRYLTTLTPRHDDALFPLPTRDEVTQSLSSHYSNSRRSPLLPPPHDANYSHSRWNSYSLFPLPITSITPIPYFPLLPHYPTLFLFPVHPDSQKQVIHGCIVYCNYPIPYSLYKFHFLKLLNEVQQNCSQGRSLQCFANNVSFLWQGWSWVRSKRWVNRGMEAEWDSPLCQRLLIIHHSLRWDVRNAVNDWPGATFCFASRTWSSVEYHMLLGSCTMNKTEMRYNWFITATGFSIFESRVRSRLRRRSRSRYAVNRKRSLKIEHACLEVLALGKT